MKVYIAEDHPLVIQGFKKLLKAHSINVTGHSLNGQALLDFLENNSVDIVILDISMPKITGLEVLKVLKNKTEKPNIIIVSGYIQITFIKDALENGAKGFVSKTLAAKSIIDAIRTVYNGKTYLSSDVKQVLIENQMQDFNPDNIYVGNLLASFLSEQELEVVKLMVNDFTNNEISENLNISNDTVRSYTRRIREKLNIKSNVGIAMSFAFLRNI